MGGGVSREICFTQFPFFLELFFLEKVAPKNAQLHYMYARHAKTIEVCLHHDRTYLRIYRIFINSQWRVSMALPENTF